MQSSIYNLGCSFSYAANSAFRKTAFLFGISVITVHITCSFVKIEKKNISPYGVMLILRLFSLHLQLIPVSTDFFCFGETQNCIKIDKSY